MKAMFIVGFRTGIQTLWVMFFLEILLVNVLCKPIAMPDSAKIRIHVPVKHHTHLHTKTVVKTVHVGIPVKPVKHHDDEEDHGWEYPKKKKSANYLKLLNN